MYLPICLLLFSAVAFGQAHEGAVDYQVRLQPAAAIELPYHPAVVNAAMKAFFFKKGKSKRSDLKGFTTYRNTKQLQADSANEDFYFKVEPKSRQENGTSVVFLLLTRAKDGMTANRLHLDMVQARNYLDELAPAIEAFILDLLIKEQNKRAVKAESKSNSLSKEGADLQKKEQRLKRNHYAIGKMKKKITELKAQKQKSTVQYRNGGVNQFV